MTRNRFINSSVVYLILFIEISLGLCPRGYFKVPFMKYCYPLLTCDDIKDVKVIKLIGFGSTKNVYLANWKNHTISFSSLRNKNYLNDFYDGLNVLKSLEPNKYLIQLVGYCELTNTILTEYHKYNNALNYEMFRGTLNLTQKFNLCIDYVEIINYLHNSPIGTRVNCDSNELEKLLSQLLITRDLNIILGDVDALPEVKINASIKCGKREIKSSFAAPEQAWRKTEPFDPRQMTGYNEKVDIWKIPDVCNYFLSGPDYDLIQYRLFGQHRKCKDLEPNNRPSASRLIDFYKYMRDIFM